MKIFFYIIGFLFLYACKHKKERFLPMFVKITEHESISVSSDFFSVNTPPRFEHIRARDQRRLQKFVYMLFVLG